MLHLSLKLLQQVCNLGFAGCWHLYLEPHQRPLDGKFLLQNWQGLHNNEAVCGSATCLTAKQPKGLLPVIPEVTCV